MGVESLASRSSRSISEGALNVKAPARRDGTTVGLP